MRKIFVLLILLCAGSAIVYSAEPSGGTRGGAMGVGSEPEVMMNETFSNVAGNESATAEIITSQLDNPEGWSFTDAYAGPGFIVVKKGGSVTTPPISELTGNATIYFSTAPWGEDIKYEDLKPHKVTIENGELCIDEIDEMSSMGGTIYMYGVSGDTRVTIIADHDIKLSNVKIEYGGSFDSMYQDDPTKYSHDAGYPGAPVEYYNPFDLIMTKTTTKVGYTDDGLHNILVYTLDGTKPQRTSQRYNGEPITISSTTTLNTATILGNGSMQYGKERTYFFPTPELPEIPAQTYTVNVSRPGTLKAQLLDIDADEIEGLVLKGKINGTDLAYLIAGEGRAAKISYLDLSEVTFEYDDALYQTTVAAPEGGMGTVSTYRYYFSEENRTERLPGGPMNENWALYRNDLSGAFSGNKIQRIVVPRCLESIGTSAFSGVKMATIPEGVTKIGPSAFYSAVEVNLPEALIEIGDYAFGRDFFKREIRLPNLEYIGDGAFAGAKITAFEFGDKLRHIGEGAFSETKLTEVVMNVVSDTIPSSLFAGCDNLSKVKISGEVKVIGDKAFYNCRNIKEFSIPSTVEEVGYEAIPYYLLDQPVDGIIYVGNVAYLRDGDQASYTVRQGTVSLADRLFSGSTASSFTLPESVKTIGKECFSYTSLKSTPEMKSVVRIGDRAFCYCLDLGRVVIPESVEYIGWNAFEGCNALWSMTYEAIDAKVEGYLSPRDLERIVIGDKVRRLPAGLYTNNTNLTEAVLPRSMEVIEPYAFQGCVNLEYVRLSDGISNISDYAFYGCKSLTDIHWPASLDSIGVSAFRDCISLKTVSLPEGTRSVKQDAFYNCPEVSTLYIASTVEELGSLTFAFRNYDKEMTITSTAEVPPYYEWVWAYYEHTPVLKVPAEYMESYRTEGYWSGSNAGMPVNLVAIGELATTSEPLAVSFASSLNSDADIADAFVGGAYITVGEEDGFDESDGSIVLNSTMDSEYAEAIGGMAPGKSDLANRFNGIVIQVPGGTGSVVIDCHTVGNRFVAVKIGDENAETFSKNSKGEISVDYNVADDTFVYIYGVDSESQEKTDTRSATRAIDSDNCVRIYEVGVNPISAGVDGITDDISDSPVTAIYTLDGVKVNAPQKPGLYILRRANGTSQKIYVK